MHQCLTLTDADDVHNYWQCGSAAMFVNTVIYHCG